MYNLIQKPAPDFKAQAVSPDGKFVEVKLSDFKNIKNVLLFFYPLNFTFVCPSELISLSNNIDKFKSLNVEVLGISIDSKNSHYAWRNLSLDRGGIGNINFTLVSDITKDISKDYCVLLDDSVALRATIFIDKNGVIRFSHINDLTVGRNIDEILRLIEAFKYVETYGEVCPVNWKKGELGFKPNIESVSNYLKKNFL